MADFVKLKKEPKEKGKQKSFFSFKAFLLFFLVFFLLSSIISTVSYSLSPKIAVIPISGPIMTQEAFTLYGDSTSSRYIAEKLMEIKEDSSIKAILFDINSPGGSPVASEEISNAIEIVKKETSIPIYCLINDVGASGAFWVAVSCDKIYASSMSTVGSIGVTSAGLSFEDFIADYNITYRKQTAGEYKDMGTPFRKMTPQEEEIIQGILDEVHKNFITHVATNRNMSYDDVKVYATGEIFLGSKAKDIGFIDEIGYYPDVLSALKGKVGDIMVVDYGPAPTFAQQLGLTSLFGFDTKSQILI